MKIRSTDFFLRNKLTRVPLEDCNVTMVFFEKAKDPHMPDWMLGWRVILSCGHETVYMKLPSQEKAFPCIDCWLEWCKRGTRPVVKTQAGHWKLFSASMADELYMDPL